MVSREVDASRVSEYGLSSRARRSSLETSRSASARISTAVRNGAEEEAGVDVSTEGKDCVRSNFRPCATPQDICQ